MATRGRKTKLTPELLDKLEKALAGGNYVETACAYVGISHSVFYHWMAEARKPKAKKIYLDFLDTIERARAVAEIRNVQIIQAAAQGDGSEQEPDWRAASWFLERAYPRKWGKHERVELSGSEGGPIDITVNAKAKLLDFLNAKAPDDNA